MYSNILSYRCVPTLHDCVLFGGQDTRKTRWGTGKHSLLTLLWGQDFGGLNSAQGLHLVIHGPRAPATSAPHQYTVCQQLLPPMCFLFVLNGRSFSPKSSKRSTTSRKTYLSSLSLKRGRES